MNSKISSKMIQDSRDNQSHETILHVTSAEIQVHNCQSIKDDLKC